MGLIGDKLERRGWNKSRIEWLNIAVTLLFWVTLILVAYSSGTLEGKCRSVLMTGEHIEFDPLDPPNFSEQLVYVNYSLCKSEIVCRKELVCDFPEFNYSDECWVGPC